MARKKQGYNARLDESMGGRSGKKSQSEKSRRDESTGMERSSGRRKYAAVGTMDKSGRVKKQMGGIVPDMSGVDERIGEIDEVDIAYEVPAYGEYGDPSMTGGREWGYIPRHPGNALGSQNAPLGRRKRMVMEQPRGYRKGGMATMPSSNTTVRGPHGGKATSKNTNMHKLNAMGKLKGQ